MISADAVIPADARIVHTYYGTRDSVLSFPESVEHIGFTYASGLSEIIIYGKNVGFNEDELTRKVPIIQAPHIPLSRFSKTNVRKAAAIGFARYMNAGGQTEPEIEEEYLAYIKKQKMRLAENPGVVEYLIQKGIIKKTDATYEVLSLKKEWDWETDNDGNRIVTMYKGSDTEVTVPSSIGGKKVTGISDWAFGSYILEDVAVYQLTQFKGFRNHALSMDYATRRSKDAAVNIQAIRKINLPEGIVFIGSNAFRNCISLEEIVIPATVKDICFSAFLGCVALKSIDVPKDCRIQQFCFAECKSLTEFHWPDGLTSIPDGILRGCSSLKNVSIPSSVTVIGNQAFAFCESLNAIRIPSSVNMIDWAAFTGDYNLTIEIDSDNHEFLVRDGSLIDKNGKLISAFSGQNIPDGVKAIGMGAFMGCRIKQLSFPQSVERVEAHAFEGSCVEKIIWNKQLREIPAFAFAQCESLKQIEIPPNVETIGYSAFYGIDMTGLKLHEGLKKVCGYAFERLCMSEIKEIHLPESLEIIENYAFSDPRDLRFVTPLSSPPAGWHFSDEKWINNKVLSERIVYLYKGI